MAEIGGVAMSKQRAAAWEASKGASGLVFCNICGGTVIPGDHWDISHVGAPAALGGDKTGVAHRECNRRDNVTFVTPFVVRAKRLYRRHFGISGPGLGDNPLPAGRRSGVTKKLNGSVEPRLTQAQKHRRTMAALYPFGRSE